MTTFQLKPEVDKPMIDNWNTYMGYIKDKLTRCAFRPNLLLID